MTEAARIPWHGNAHRLGGPDPHDTGLHTASLMGLAVGGSFLSNGFGFMGAHLYLPDRDGPPLEAGEQITVSYAHAAPPGHFHYIACRIHVVTGLEADDYNYIEPHQSDPWRGSVGSYELSDPFPVFGGMVGLVSIAAVTNEDGDTVTWTYPDTGAEAEQFAFDMTAAGSGHIGYSFHDFGSPHVSGDVTAAFAGTATEREGSFVFLRSAAFAMGDVVADDALDDPDAITNHIDLILTDDVPAGSQLLIVGAVKGPDRYEPANQAARPIVWSRQPTGTEIGKFKVGSQYHQLRNLIIGDLNFSSPAWGDIDGGAP